MSRTSCRRKEPSGWKNINTQNTHRDTHIHTHTHALAKARKEKVTLKSKSKADSFGTTNASHMNTSSKKTSPFLVSKKLNKLYKYYYLFLKIF